MLVIGGSSKPGAPMPPCRRFLGEPSAEGGPKLSTRDAELPCTLCGACINVAA